MARKVFMSVLGATNYQECLYVDHRTNFKSSKTRFVQVAMFEKVVRHWTSEDIAYIFLTSGEKGSEKKNWFDNGHFRYGTNEPIASTGLKRLLNEMNLNCKIEPVMIKNGDSESEIWENFRIIFNCLQPGDEVYFDVTHGFRSLPMLVLVLNNYSKFLKNIKVALITYGNYEARNEQNEAPIIDLTPLSALQDWTIAASTFIETGKTNKITSLAGNEEFVVLNKFVNQIYECRGNDIIKGESAVKARQLLESSAEKLNNFDELLKKLAETFKDYQIDDIVNGFRAVQFCIKHHLVQQGITLLQESTISLVLSFLGYNYFETYLRDTVSGVLSINPDKFEPKGITEDEKKVSFQLAKKISQQPFYKNLSEIYSRLSMGSRNDINHAGMREKSRQVGEIEKSLAKYFGKTVKLFELKL